MSTKVSGHLLVVSGRIFDLFRATGSEEGLEGKIGAKDKLKSMMRGAEMTHDASLDHTSTRLDPILQICAFNCNLTGALARALGIQDMTLPPMQEETGQTSKHLE
ncbi:hypothetical protein BY996DRAFT_6495440 [Phakopsora pachyrhizi]|nr:hypothetical protein BY996DRAFT_6495440 [Phakopsora pachyrhizi]